MTNAAAKFDAKTYLKNLTERPGVYQMLAEDGNVLYVGKAQNLKKRVASYFSRSQTNVKTKTLVKQIHDIKVIITETDSEALLLENNLIKKYQPKYNVLFRDDKSYPYIYLATAAKFPRIDFYRGSKKKKGAYYGPYPSAGAVRESLNLLQKLFKIRQCSDIFFNNRTRPCIQYQIKRCSAPCVGYISAEDYQQSIALAKLFLEGKNLQLMTDLIKKMELAARQLDYEQAAIYRDQIANLRKIQEQQYITSDGHDVDVIAVAKEKHDASVQVLMFRAGRLIGNRVFYPKVTAELEPQDVIAGFLSQYYLTPIHQKDIPKEILIAEPLADTDWLARVLAETASYKVKIYKPTRGERRRWLQMAIANAQSALKAHLASKLNYVKRIQALQKTFKLANLPQRLECFDVSHSSGEATVASCVVFDSQGPTTKDYRRFNIEGVTKGDDYGALRQALNRRYTRIKMGEGVLPDVIIIDGGKGQLHQAEGVLEELQISGVSLLGIAKGASRKPGLETIFISGEPNGIALPPDSLALHLLQQIRDEAHRFAITGQKRRLEKQRKVSTLESIPAVGPKRRKALVNYFGGLQEIKKASVAELAKVPGISQALAREIYDRLHG